VTLSRRGIEKGTRDPLLRLEKDRLRVMSPPTDMDMIEAYAAIGATGNLSEPLPVDAKKALRTLILRRGPLIVEGPRGGRQLASFSPSIRSPHILPEVIQVDTMEIRSVIPAGTAWDILSWAPRMNVPRFISLEAVTPGGMLHTKHPVLLLRARIDAKNWAYFSYNVAGKGIEGAWKVGSREGWSVRDRAAERMLDMPPLLSKASQVPAAPFIYRNERRLRSLEKKLQQAFGSALVVDASKTLYPESITCGRKARALGAIHRAYGRVSPAEVVVVLMPPKRGVEKALLKLAESSGMLFAIEDALSTSR